MAFTQYTKPNYQANWHHVLVAEYLDAFVAGEIKRLMVFEPPRHGKSEQVSRRLPAYILGRNPDALVIACSYSATLAARLNRDVQRIIDSPEYRRLFPNTQMHGANVRTVASGSYLRNSDVFEVVGHTGSYTSAGVGGPITGFGFKYGIIDDPTKNRKDAESEVYREALWEWYTSTFYSRQEEDAGILITLTRWHEDGLEGRLLQRAKENPNAEQWTVLSLPAIAEDPVYPDCREEGEALWPDKYDLDFLRTVQEQNPYDWASLYQQRPTAREGNMFKWDWFTDKYVDAVPIDADRVRYWDNAGTQGGGAYSCGLLMAKTAEGYFYVEDVVRGQWSAGEREAVKKATAQRDAEKYGNRVRIWQEQEPGSGGKESAENTVRNLAGYSVQLDRVTGDKVMRAEPFAAQCQVGNVYIVSDTPEHRWNSLFLNELCSFPHGKFKDQVDTAGGAFNKLALEPSRELLILSRRH